MRIKNDSHNPKTLFWVLANQISFSKTHFGNAKKINEMGTKLTTPIVQDCMWPSSESVLFHFFLYKLDYRVILAKQSHSLCLY